MLTIILYEYPTFFFIYIYNIFNIWDKNLNKISIKNTKSYIFTKNINNHFKSTPFHLINNPVGKPKYFPPFFKEWKNSIYSFNSNVMKNLLMYDIHINNLIKTYFSAFFDKELLFNKFEFRKSKYLSSNKIHVSQAEIKHTNSKAIITIYTYNLERLALLKKIKQLRNFFYKKIFFFVYKNKNYNNSTSYITSLKNIFSEEILLIRRFKLKFNLNKYKFEEKFIAILAQVISNFYNKKVEFNIVKLKCIVLNSDLFTKFLTLKLKSKKLNTAKILNFILHRVVLPKANRIEERSKIKKKIDLDIIENKYKNLHLSSVLNNNNKILNISYNNSNNYEDLSNLKLYNIIFNSINYKNMSGIRLEIKGRLTKRYRADRAIFKLRWKGGLQNIDSSYKGLSSVIMRGYVRPNVEGSMFSSRRRIGAFAAKGWISGK